MNLHTRLSDYLSLRRSLGYKLVSDGKLLNGFVCYLLQNKLDYITVGNALTWAKQSTSKRPCHWCRRLGIVRGFASYLSALDQRTEIPPVELLSGRYQRPTPFILTRREIDQLLQGAMSRPNTPKILQQSLCCIYGLMSVTGLRISEALNLKDLDVNLATGVITVECSKFGKSRLVPLHRSTVTALQTYQDIRKQTFGHSLEHFFANQYGKPIRYDCVRYHFQKIFKSMEYASQPGKLWPTLHDIRHYFAISTITHWYETGEDVQAKLPRLSAYLGQVETRDTYWYLSACPNLMLAAAQRLENNQGEVK